MTAALGTSRVRPTGTSLGARRRPRARSSARASASRSRAARRSAGPATKGNMIRSGPVRRRAQQGAQLGAEGRGIAPQQPQRPLAQRRVGAGGPAGRQVLRAHVPGAHRDRVRASSARAAGGRPRTAAPRWATPRAAQQVLGAEEADALRAVRAARSPPRRGTPTLASRRTRTPSRVTRGQRRASAAGARPRGGRCSWAARKPARAGADGSTTTSPRGAVHHHQRPRAGCARVASLQADHGGDAEERARIDVWWVGEPASVATASTRSQSSSAASEGVRSAATSTKLPGQAGQRRARRCAPPRLSWMRPSTSSRSVLRSRR